jgi:hypothetical protein
MDRRNGSEERGAGHLHVKVSFAYGFAHSELTWQRWVLKMKNGNPESLDLAVWS